MKTILLIIPVFLASCCHNVDCKKNSLRFYFVSFSSSEIDTLVFKKFQVGTNFQNPKDVMQINDISVFRPYSQGDTVNFEAFNSSNSQFEIQAGFDYEIIFPAINRTVKISDIIENQTEEKFCDISDGSKICYNPIISYNVDGLVESSNYFYIVR